MSSPLQQEDYELMMEDEINFVMVDKVEGTEQDMVGIHPPLLADLSFSTLQEDGMSEAERKQLTLEEVSDQNVMYFVNLTCQTLGFGSNLYILSLEKLFKI